MLSIMMRVDEKLYFTVDKKLVGSLTLTTKDPLTFRTNTTKLQVRRHSPDKVRVFFEGAEVAKLFRLSKKIYADTIPDVQVWREKIIKKIQKPCMRESRPRPVV